MTDASDFAVRAVLQQEIGESWQPVAFFSRKLRPAELRYSAFDRELLAVYFAVKHYQHFVEGREFYVLTDHKPLTFALSSTTDKYTPWQTRHLDYISQFTTDIWHVRGGANQAADALSRAAIDAITPSPSSEIDFEDMAGAQDTDPELQALQDSPSSSLQLAKVPHLAAPVTLVCDMSTGSSCPFVPQAFRWAAFHSLHSLSHPGIRATQRLIADRFVWPRMNADIREWTRSCQHCQRAKVQRHTVTPLGTFANLDARFDQIHVDIVRPLPPSCGFTYLLTCVDRFTRWPDTLPMADISTDSVARTFVSGWVARCGVPSTITTDRGRRFESHLWRVLTELLGCHHLRTTVYHPSANGMVERFHQQLKASLKAKTPVQWTDSLPKTLLGIRTALKHDLQCSVAELVYGSTLRLPGEFLQQSLPVDNLASLVGRLKNAMRQLRATYVRPQPHHKVHIHRAHMYLLEEI